MAQNDYGNPASPFSGTQLNNRLRDWRDALHTLHRGASRPSYAQAGMLWLREVSGTSWELMLYTGTTDIIIGAVNPSTGAISAGPYVRVAGDTMTGDLTISKPSALLEFNSATPSLRGLQFNTNGLRRWRFYAWNDAESGGNAGSTLYLSRYDDAGDPIAHVFFVDRSTGRLTFSGGILPRVPAVDPTDSNDVVRKAYADRSGPGGSSNLIATTSGTTYDVTGIPNWVNVIEVLFIDITTASSTSLRVRLGTSNGFVNSGYTSAYGSRLGEVSDTTCFISFATNVQPSSGIMRIVRAGGTTWVQSHVGFEAGNRLSGGGGNVDIGTTLTRIRVYISSSNFTGGSFAVRWTA